MRISINDLLDMLATEATERDAQPEQPDYDTADAEFDNNANELRRVYNIAVKCHYDEMAFSIIKYANELKINLTPKA